MFPSDVDGLLQTALCSHQTSLCFHQTLVASFRRHYVPNRRCWPPADVIMFPPDVADLCRYCVPTRRCRPLIDVIMFPPDVEGLSTSLCSHQMLVASCRRHYVPTRRCWPLIDVIMFPPDVAGQRPLMSLPSHGVFGNRLQMRLPPKRLSTFRDRRRLSWSWKTVGIIIIGPSCFPPPLSPCSL